MSFLKVAFIFCFSLTVCHISLGDFILFENRIDAQQKTELRYDVPDGCVLTGLGFRAAYDNITTMHCRYHRLLPNGKLADPREVHLGSEPNHACEAKVMLPDGWVAVGFGAAGEPEWDITLLRLWARRLNADGTLGEMKTYSDGFKPDRGCEREIILADPDRMIVGAGLRFHHNDIQGIYCRSKRIMDLDERNRRNLRGFTGRGWVLDAEHVTGLDRLSRDIEKFNVKRIDLRFKNGVVPSSSSSKAIRFLSDLSAKDRKQAVQTFAWIDTANSETVRKLFRISPYLTGIVVDLLQLQSSEQTKDGLKNLYALCRKAQRRLCLRLCECTNSDHDKFMRLIRSLPRDVGLIIPFDEYQLQVREATAFDPTLYGKRDITIELDLTNCPAGPMLPDIRMNNLAGLILKAASNGAKGFIVHANISDHYVPDTFNAVGLYALNRLADDPFQPTDVLWSELCSMRYGAAAKQAMAALKLTESTNDLIFRIFGIPVLWDGRKISSMDIADRKLERFLDESSSAALKELLEPTDKTVERVRQDKETALWLISQSVASAKAAEKINPSAELRSLPKAMERLQMTVQFWRYAAHAYLLARVYAIDGAPVTRSSAEAVLKSLRELDEQSTEMRDLVSMFKGTDAFIASVENWLRAHEKTAKLPRNFARIQGLINQRQDEAAVRALDELMRSDRFAPHLSKHNDTIGRLASSINALCEPSNTLRVVRGGDGQWNLRKVAGRWGWTMEPKRPCIYLDMLAGPLNQPADYVISFEYFDKGDWKIYFHYDSDYPPDQKREYHPVEPLQLTNTGTWKNGSFLLTNCRFASSQNVNADMRFVSGTGASIRNIRLELK
ncbi:MAG: hypothetical protein ACYTDW_13350 [Planctomycetota bacterium]